MNSLKSADLKKIQYCDSFYSYRRRKTRVVKVGDVGIGGNNPIRIQSMTTTLTSDTDATVAQTIRLAKAGCEIVRITVPTVEESKNLKNIKKQLMEKGIKIPLVADVHFLPAAAMEAAEHAEKVRINPGNFSDSKLFKVNESEYKKELEKIEERFTPFVLKMKKLGRAMRIGVNHGSLSDRIMNRYGDTAEGMVESALEFVRLCEKNDYYDVVFSMKSSNVKVMIGAYRLLASKMNELGMDYPFHLGVTEAGEGEDGRIKSAIGIGALLEEGIGDTIRVSLTEEPENEIPVCVQIATSYNKRIDQKPDDILEKSYGKTVCYAENPYQYSRNKTKTIEMGAYSVGGENPVRIISDFDAYFTEKQKTGVSVSDALIFITEQISNKEMSPEIIQWTIRNEKDLKNLENCSNMLRKKNIPWSFLGRFENSLNCLDGGLPLVQCALFKYQPGDDSQTRKNKFTEFVQKAKLKNIPVMLESVNCNDPEKLAQFGALTPAHNMLNGIAWAEENGIEQMILSFNLPEREQLIHNVRFLSGELKSKNKNFPIHLKFSSRNRETFDDYLINSSITSGSLLCDGIGDAIQIGQGKNPNHDLELSYNILQAAGVRVTKTEYISCPSCGRTLFDLKSAINQIRSKTGHLKGVKIAIMGCIVNGPGEMADAHFGYVGGAPGKINLYVGKQCVQKNIPAEIAVEKLIGLIKQQGKWQGKNG